MWLDLTARVMRACSLVGGWNETMAMFRAKLRCGQVGRCDMVVLSVLGR